MYLNEFIRFLYFNLITNKYIVRILLATGSAVFIEVSPNGMALGLGPRTKAGSTPVASTRRNRGLPTANG